jgi:hypothetical protein
MIKPRRRQDKVRGGAPFFDNYPFLFIIGSNVATRRRSISSRSLKIDGASWTSTWLHPAAAAAVNC